MDKDKEIIHWKRNVNKAEEVLGYTSKTMPLRQKRRIELFMDIAEIREGKDILEIGCGTGNFTKGLAKSKAHIIAIDLSEELLDLAKDKTFENNVEFRVGDAENLPFGDNSFDAVVGNSVLHHCSLECALKEIKRVIKNGGKVIFSEPNMLNPHVFLQKKIKYLKRLAGDSPGETAFFRWELKKSFVWAGFTDIIIRPFDFLYPATPVCFINTVNKLGLILERIPMLKEIAGSLIISANVRKDS